MKKFTVIICMVFIAVPLLAESFSVGGINVSINLPPEYEKFFNGAQDVGFMNDNGHYLFFSMRTSSDPLSDKYSWEKNMNGYVGDVVTHKYNALSSRYTGSDTIDGIGVQRFTSKIDCGKNSWLIRIALFPVKHNTYLIAISSIDTEHQSYYDLENLENKGEQLLYRIRLK